MITRDRLGKPPDPAPVDTDAAFEALGLAVLILMLDPVSGAHWRI
ncbi:hypothetical protein [Kribbella pittospori]|nr:hypothetical protein [Kribbella pittospori]